MGRTLERELASEREVEGWMEEVRDNINSEYGWHGESLLICCKRADGSSKKTRLHLYQVHGMYVEVWSLFDKDEEDRVLHRLEGPAVMQSSAGDALVEYWVHGRRVGDFSEITNLNWQKHIETSEGAHVVRALANAGYLDIGEAVVENLVMVD